MKKYLRLIPALAAVLLMVFLVRCAVNPVTGKKEVMLISESAEINMGAQIDRSLRLEYGLYQDARLRSYVDRIGQRLAPYTHRPHLKYHFAVLDTPVENAFAAPGGYIYVTRGLMAMVNSEAELAAVLGHELGHVNARHSAQQMTRSMLITLGILIAGELNEDIRKIAPISMIAAQLLFLKYSRSNEFQADKLGIEYAFKAGYSAGEMVSFFDSLQHLTESKGGPRLPNFLSTHPMTPRRIESLKEHLQGPEYGHYQEQNLVLEKNGYLQRLDGMVYGSDPQQGYVKGQTFYHPGMQFFFRIPYGWKHNNTPRQVTLSKPDGTALVIMRAENTTEPLDRYTSRALETLSNPRLLRGGVYRVNGLNAYYSLVEIPTGSTGNTSEPVNVGIHCIRKGGTVFTFFTASALSDYSKNHRSMGNVVNSFNQLRNSRHLSRKSRRLFIKRAGRGKSLRQFMRRLQIPMKDWKKIQILNGMELDQSLTPNQLVKIIR